MPSLWRRSRSTTRRASRACADDATSFRRACVEMMRRGDDPKLTPEAEQAQLEKLRREREIKASALLQAEAQSISAKMVGMALGEIPAVAKSTVKSDKTLAKAPKEAQIALVLNMLLRSCCPPEVKEAPQKGKGNKKQANSVKAAAAAKVIEGTPPGAAEVRKVVKANKAMLAETTSGTAAGQLSLLKAFQSWLVSSQGANALVHSPKVMEVLYDVDLVEEEVALKYWTDLQAQLVREEAELAEQVAAHKRLSEEKAGLEEAVRVAEAEESDAAWYNKKAEETAQAARCGGNPSKDDEANEKAALSALKKCKDYYNQTGKVLAARSKNLMEVNIEYEASLVLVNQLTTRSQGGGALFAKHAAPFFEWLAADDEDEEEDEKDEKPDLD